MKLKKTNTKVTEYTVSYDGSDYIITITEEEKTFPDATTDIVYGAWIREKNQGIQSFMFGLLKKDVTEKEFIAIVTAQLEERIDSYNDEIETIESAYMRLIKGR